jgi:hypothetical protein
MMTSPTTRRSLAQVFVTFAVLGVVGLVALFGGAVLLSSALNKSPDETTESSCPFDSGCTTMTVSEVVSYTGYQLPEGSTVEWAFAESSWFDNSWSMLALVSMPPGSETPASVNALSSIREISDSASGHAVEVSAVYPQGAPR